MRSRLVPALRASSLFSRLGDDALSALEAELELVHLTSGEVLFRQGDAGDSLFIVISGRLLVSFTTDGQVERVIERPGQGEIVGEMALLNDAPRSATVCAARDALLAKLTKESLARVSARYPEAIFAAIARQLSTRLDQKVKGVDRRNSTPNCIAVAPLSANVPADVVCVKLASALGQFGRTLHLSSERVQAIFADARIAQAKPSDLEHGRLANWLTEQEALHAKLLYQADWGLTPWTARCLRQADLVLFVARFDDQIDEARAAAQALSQNTGGVQRSSALLLLHDAQDVEPAGTARWTQAVKAERHFHIRLPREGDFARLARFVDRRSVGLALGGGFARGLGHVGVIRAMRDLGIPIDMVGGTSMGAIIAGQCAVEWDAQTMLETSAARSAASLKGDYTLPFVSLLSGRKISASLTRCEMRVHASGDAAKSIIASARAPGMFPPLSWNGELLVDGGLVNMVPADVLRQFLGGGTVISVDVSPRIEFENVNFGLHFSGWRALWRKMNPFSQKREMVGLVDVLMRTLEFGRAPYARPWDHADAHLVLPLSQYSHRDFNRGKEMAEIGYEFAMNYFTDWIKTFGRPWDGAAS